MGRLHDSHIIQQWKNDFGGNLQHKGHMLGKRRERKQVPLGKKAVTAMKMFSILYITSAKSLQLPVIPRTRGRKLMTGFSVTMLGSFRGGRNTSSRSS